MACATAKRCKILSFVSCEFVVSGDVELIVVSLLDVACWGSFSLWDRCTAAVLLITDFVSELHDPEPGTTTNALAVMVWRYDNAVVHTSAKGVDFNEFLAGKLDVILLLRAEIEGEDDQNDEEVNAEDEGGDSCCVGDTVPKIAVIVIIIVGKWWFAS